MAVANYNRKMLDLKRWVLLASIAPVATTAGAFVASSRMHMQRQMYVASAAAQYLYDPFEDGFVQIPSAALAGTFGDGACGTSSAQGPNGTATGGSTTTLITNLSLARSLAGYKIHITAGPGAGDIRTIKYNTIGANGVITVDSAFSAAITAASTYRLLTPRWYVLNAGTVAANIFKVYDFATNTWTGLATANLPATIATDGKLVATPSYTDHGNATSFATGTATAGAATTLTNSAKAWTANQWTNYQVRITGGTGAGQIRTIASNTGTILTVSAAWTTNPDATSTYAIEGNDDFIYYIGNAAVTLYRYSISANTWTALTPGAARSGAPGAGLSAHWVFDVPSTIDDRWSNESDIINGRRIYSFRGAAGGVLDYYDIALNTWVSAVAYSPATETFTTGTKYVYACGYLYAQKDITGRWFRYSFAEAAMVGWSYNPIPGSTAVVGDTAFDAVEPETGIRFVYMILNTSVSMARCMIV